MREEDGVARTHDLTRGSVYGLLARLAAPLIAGNILQQLYNAVDAFVLGRFAGADEFAAIGIAGSVMNLFLFAAVGACTGISVLFSQLYGAGDLPGFRREHFLSLAYGLACALVLGAAGTLCLPVVLAVIQTPAHLAGHAASYLRVILLSLPVSYAYNLYSALLRSVGRPTAALAALAAAVTLNLGLDVLFVAELGLGIAGAAWATAISQLVSAVICVLHLLRVAPELVFSRDDCRRDRDMLRQTARLASVTALHQSGLYLGKLLVQGAVNTGGDAVIAAYTATTRIEGFANSFGDSAAAATSVVTANNFGAKMDARVRETFRASLVMTAALGLVCSAALYLSAGAASAFMLGEASGAAFESARSYLQTVALFYVFCFTGNTFAGYFDGCGRVTVPFVGSASHIALRVVLSWLMIGRMGLDAVAAATGAGWIMVNALWTAIYRRGRCAK